MNKSTQLLSSEAGTNHFRVCPILLGKPSDLESDIARRPLPRHAGRQASSVHAPRDRQGLCSFSLVSVVCSFLLVFLLPAYANEVL